MTNNPDPEKIAVGLKRIRFLRKFLLVIVILFAPLVYFMAMKELSLRLVMTVGIAWICVGVIVELLIGFARCPACRGYFHVRGMNGNIFAKKCMNCGVALKQEG
jgi:hypothetical protein